jgi:hypothetical protein
MRTELPCPPEVSEKSLSTYCWCGRVVRQTTPHLRHHTIAQARQVAHRNKAGFMRARLVCGVVRVGALATSLGVVVAGAAGATSATATIAPGPLAFVSAPPAVTFRATPNVADQPVTATQALDVGDASGSPTGWAITATSTTFSTGGGSPTTLSTSATTITSAPSVACDTAATCTPATNATTYPYTLPAATTAPTPTKVYDTAATTGLGTQTVTLTWHLAVPADAAPGSYTSSWTLSLVSGP